MEAAQIHSHAFLHIFTSRDLMAGLIYIQYTSNSQKMPLTIGPLGGLGIFPEARIILKITGHRRWTGTGAHYDIIQSHKTIVGNQCYSELHLPHSSNRHWQSEEVGKLKQVKLSMKGLQTL